MSDRPAETEYSALQALLQIRSNSSQGEGSAAGENGASDGTTRGANATQTVSASSAAANAGNLANLLRMNADNATLFQQTAQVSLNPTQLASLRAAAANTLGRSNLLQAAAFRNQSLSMAAAAAAVASRPTAAALHHHSPLFADAMARDPSLAAAAVVATAPLAPTLDLPRSPALSPIRQATAGRAMVSGGRSPVVAPRVAPIAARPPEIAPGTPAASQQDQAEIKVRKDEVEAALRSKPQRGRKRENLNAEERLELTRTRNREHAKSTRIRKKARYQELLDTEQKFLEFQNEAEIKGKRSGSMMKFLDARARMLNEALTKRHQHDDETEEAKNKSNETRAVSFDRAEDEVKLGAEPQDKAIQNLTHGLSEILEDVKTFRFETSVGDILAHDHVAMSQFDDFVAGRFDELLGRGSSYRFSYRVIGSEDGVALNKDGAGFAKVDLVASEPSDAVAFPKENDKILQSSVVYFQFAKDSPLLSSVCWCVLKDVLDSSSSIGGKSESTAKESLESQTVYPSVVSFDENHRDKSREMAVLGTAQHAQGSSDHAQEENPGMSI
ncbi:expressed unknown protein [Seminavis robusta]|uniref:BZIP domain-containing protein n=1 Tax=Seminavis robusta TaxID=568900 RepID=A0A9N8DGA1_9STRA|nr:expressed unknown protein [Seminavis robusta]|eukprot:Sro104_g053030.1 n/a (557) ;mRNA; f:112249-114083